MARSASRPKPPDVVIEYENLEASPSYIEGIHGLVTPKGAVQMYFYSDYVTPPLRLEPETSLPEADEEQGFRVKVDNPYQTMSGGVRIVRRIGANLVVTPNVLREIHTWMGNLLQGMEEHPEALHSGAPIRSEPT